MRHQELTDKNVFVFKTNIENPEKIEQVKPILGEQMSVLQWSIDIEDVDRVLRVEAIGCLTEKWIADSLLRIGVDCTVMTW